MLNTKDKEAKETHDTALKNVFTTWRKTQRITPRSPGTEVCTSSTEEKVMSFRVWGAAVGTRKHQQVGHNPCLERQVRIPTRKQLGEGEVGKKAIGNNLVFILDNEEVLKDFKLG